MLALLLSLVGPFEAGGWGGSNPGAGAVGGIWEGGAPLSPPGSVGDAAAAREARCFAARALALAFLAGPQWFRRPDAGVDAEAAEAEVEEVEGRGRGRASSSSMASFTCVALPLLVGRVRVADLPAFLTEWNISIKTASSPSILAQESELL